MQDDEIKRQLQEAIDTACSFASRDMEIQELLTGKSKNYFTGFNRRE